MRTVVLSIIAGILISNSADLYCRIQFENWTIAHKGKTIGMPSTFDFCLAELIAKPIDKFANNDILCGLGE